jgi:hypothetical protein
MGVIRAVWSLSAQAADQFASWTYLDAPFGRWMMRLAVGG